MLINPAQYNSPMMGGAGPGNQQGLAPQIPGAPQSGPGGMVQNMTPNAPPQQQFRPGVAQAAAPGQRTAALTGVGAGNSTLPGSTGMNPFTPPNPAQFSGPGGTNSLGATAQQQQIGNFNNPNAAMPNQTPQARMSAMVQALRARGGQ